MNLINQSYYFCLRKPDFLLFYSSSHGVLLTSLHSVVPKPTNFYIVKLLLTCRESEYIHCSSLLTWSIFILPNLLLELFLHVAVLGLFFLVFCGLFFCFVLWGFLFVCFLFCFVFLREGIWILVTGFTLKSLMHVLVADEPTSNVYRSMPVLQCENVTSFPKWKSNNSTWFKHDPIWLSTLQDLAAGDKQVADLQLKWLCGYI